MSALVNADTRNTLLPLMVDLGLRYRDAHDKSDEPAFRSAGADDPMRDIIPLIQL